MNTMYRILGKRGRITIPFEMRRRVGFAYNDVLSFTEAEDGKSVIVRREKICNNCKGTKNPVQSGSELSLLEFLNGLSEAEQRAALIHLSVIWAEKQAVNAGESEINASGVGRELAADTVRWAEKQGGNLNVGT